MVKFFTFWLILGLLATGYMLTLDTAMMVGNVTPPMDLHAAEQLKFVLVMGTMFVGMVAPLWVLVRLGVLALLLRFGAQQWYAGRDQQHYGD